MAEVYIVMKSEKPKPARRNIKMRLGRLAKTGLEGAGCIYFHFQGALFIV